MVEENHDEASKEEEGSGEDQGQGANHIRYEASTGAFGLELALLLKQNFNRKNLSFPPGSAPPASHVDGVVTLPVRRHDGKPGRSQREPGSQGGAPAMEAPAAAGRSSLQRLPGVGARS